MAPEPSQHAYGVAIVGAGIAGTFLAALLREESVTVLDRLRPNSAPPAIATLWPDALWLLDVIGVGQTLDASNLPPVTCVSFQHVDGSRVEGPVPTYLGRGHAIGPSRTTLMAALHGHLKSTPVDYRPATTVAWVEWDLRNRRWKIGLRSGARNGTLTADILVAADGRFSSTAPLLSTRRYCVRELSNRMRFQYARVPQSWPLETMFKTYHGPSPTAAHAFIQPADYGEVGIGFEGARTAATRPTFVAELAQFEDLDREIGGLEWLRRPLEVPLGPMWKQHAEAEHCLLIGDAGLYMDPVTGQGIGNALVSAVFAFQAVTRFRVGDVSWREVADEYTFNRDCYTAADFERACTAASFDDPEQVGSSPMLDGREIDTYTNKTFPDGRLRRLDALLDDALTDFHRTRIGGQL